MEYFKECKVSLITSICTDEMFMEKTKQGAGPTGPTI